MTWRPARNLLPYISLIAWSGIFGASFVSAREFLDPPSDLIAPHITPGFTRIDNYWGEPVDPSPTLRTVENIFAMNRPSCEFEVLPSLKAVLYPELLVSSRNPIKGTLVRIQVRAPKHIGASNTGETQTEEGKVFFADKIISLNKERETDREIIYEALLGIPNQERVEDQGLCVKLGSHIDCTHLRVQPGHYKKTTVKVNKEKVRPHSPAEEALFKEAFANPTSDRLWNERFTLPVRNPAIKDSYGKQRRYVDEDTGELLIQSRPHGGVDYLSPAGTPVLAPASGKVVLVAPLNAEGNAVFVDHGRGLYTMYFHLSEFAPEIHAGQFIKQGDLIGFSGNTGRVERKGPGNGNHLHYGAQVWGTMVNPEDLSYVLSQDLKPEDNQHRALKRRRQKKSH